MSTSKFWYIVAYAYIAAVAVLVSQFGIVYEVLTLAVIHVLVVLTMQEFRSNRIRQYAKLIRRGVMSKTDVAATETCWMLVALISAMIALYLLTPASRLYVPIYALSPVLYLVVAIVRRQRSRTQRKRRRLDAEHRFIRVPGTPV